MPVWALVLIGAPMGAATLIICSTFIISARESVLEELEGGWPKRK